MTWKTDFRSFRTVQQPVYECIAVPGHSLLNAKSSYWAPEWIDNGLRRCPQSQAFHGTFGTLTTVRTVVSEIGGNILFLK